MQTFCVNNAQVAISITQNKQCIRFCFYYNLVTLFNDVTHNRTNVITYNLHVNLRTSKFEILEEYTIEVIVIVLTDMNQKYTKVLGGTY